MARRIGPLTAIFFWAALAGTTGWCSGQAPVLIAAGKGRAFAHFDRTVEKSVGVGVVAQIGRTLRMARIAPTMTVAPLGVIELGETVFLWDYISAEDLPPNGGVCSLGADEFLVQAFGDAPGVVRLRAKAGDFLRGLPTGDPERATIVLGKVKSGLRFLLPTTQGLLVLTSADGRETERFQVPLPVSGEQTPGWGLGYRMTSRIATPFFAIGNFGAVDRRELLYRSGSRFAVVGLESGSKPRAYGPAPASVAATILNFDHAVPPLSVDWDRDGRGDLIVTDPGQGTTILYRGAGRPAAEARQPDFICREAGWALSRTFGDFDGDGRDDLCLGTVPKLNLLEQVQALRSQKIPVRVTIRRQLADGAFESAPFAQARCDMPIFMSLTRNRRAVRFRAPVAAAPWGRRTALLVANDATLASVLLLGDDGTLSKVGSVGGEIQSKESWVRPFDPPTSDIDGDGLPEVLCVLADSDAGIARIFLARSARL